jgi:hypothetical protein
MFPERAFHSQMRPRLQMNLPQYASTSQIILIGAKQFYQKCGDDSSICVL